MKTRLLALGLAGCLLAGCLCACSDTGDAAGESSLPDRKDGGSRTLTGREQPAGSQRRREQDAHRRQ